MKDLIKKHYSEWVEIYKSSNTYIEFTEQELKLIYLVEEVVDFYTYCDNYTIRIGKQLLDILKYIFSTHTATNITCTNDYSNDELEFTYCLYT